MVNEEAGTPTPSQRGQPQPFNSRAASILRQSNDVIGCVMPFAIAALFALLVAGTASAQSVLDDKGRVYPCLHHDAGLSRPGREHVFAAVALRSAAIPQAHSTPALLGCAAAGTLHSAAVNRPCARPNERNRASRKPGREAVTLR